MFKIEETKMSLSEQDKIYIKEIIENEREFYKKERKRLGVKFVEILGHSLFIFSFIYYEKYYDVIIYYISSYFWNILFDRLY